MRRVQPRASQVRQQLASPQQMASPQQQAAALQQAVPLRAQPLLVGAVASERAPAETAAERRQLRLGAPVRPRRRWDQWQWREGGDSKEMSIPYQLQKLFANLQTADKRAVETTELTHSFGWTAADAFQQQLGDFGHTRFGVPVSGGIIAIDIAKIALPFDERIA